MPRRRFQFGMRTLLVALTLFAVFVGYHLNWIRQRREFLENNHVAYSTGKDLVPLQESLELPDEAVPAPGLLWLFGAEGVSWMAVRRDSIERARELFPEARIEQFLP